MGEKNLIQSAPPSPADTVATAFPCPTTRPGQGWMGVCFQDQPGEEPSEIIIHAAMLDSESVLEQEALGILGVNLIHGAFYLCNRDPKVVIHSLMDGLSKGRIEIDMIRFSGPAFPAVDNRLMSLQLVESELTGAALFTAAGEVVQPSEVLYGKPVLMERGSFLPHNQPYIGHAAAGAKAVGSAGFESEDKRPSSCWR